MIMLVILNNWHMESIEFVLAFPQAPIKTDIYMRPTKVPSGFSIPDLPTFSDRFLRVYKLLKNLYSLKDAGGKWFGFLKKGLLKRGGKKFEIDLCLFTKDRILLVVYVDDAILISPHKTLINIEVKYRQESYNLIDAGELKDYPVTHFTKLSDRSIKLSQPNMVERVLQVVGLDYVLDCTKMHYTPAISTNF